MDLKFYLSLFLRRLHYFLLFLCLGTAVGGILAMVLPPIYRAQAVLVVESEQIPSELAATTVQTETTEALQIIQQRILTRERLLEMSNRLAIYDAPGSPDRARMTADDVVTDLRERISIQTTGGNARGTVQATIVTVGFEAPAAALSARVTNEIVTLILQENIAIRTDVAGETLEFFVQEVERLDRELAERGAEILAFQERNLNALPDSLDFRRSQQAAAQERLVQLDREEATLRDRRNQLVVLFESTGQVLAGETAALSAEERQLQGLKDERAAALAVLSPQNPRIRMLDAQIEALEQVISERPEVEEAPQGRPASPTEVAFEIQLADIDAQLAFINDQKDQIAETMEALRLSIEATPGNAIALDTLERDYTNIRAQYDQAVASRARAETGDIIEALSKGQRISVIEQAVAPQSPESPNRPLIAAAGVGMGFMMGIGIIVLLEMLNSSVRRPSDITAKLGIVPFGTLPFVRTRGEKLRRRVLIILAFALVIIAVPAGLWWVNENVTPLDLLLRRIMDKLG